MLITRNNRGEIIFTCGISLHFKQIESQTIKIFVKVKEAGNFKNKFNYDV